MTQNADAIHEAVQQHYGAIARSNQIDEQTAACCGGAGACCGSSDSATGNVNLYGTEMLEGLPVDVTGLSLGCGESQFA